MPDPISSNAQLAVEQERIAFTNTEVHEADFRVKCKGVTFYSTAAVHIGFDGEPASTGSFLIPATTVVDLRQPLEFTRVSALGDAGSGTLYILARR